MTDPSRRARWAGGRRVPVGLGGHLSDGFSSASSRVCRGGQPPARAVDPCEVMATYEVQDTMVTALGRGHWPGRVQFQPMSGFAWVQTGASLVEGAFRTISGTV